PSGLPGRRHVMRITLKIAFALTVMAGITLVVSYAGSGVQAQTAPRFKYDPDWPKPLPNKWKMGGVTGLAVDKDDNVWVLNRPNDLTSIEIEAELDPPLADCCAHAPAMIHFDKAGNVIESFDAPQGHGMAVAAAVEGMEPRRRRNCSNQPSSRNTRRPRR